MITTSMVPPGLLAMSFPYFGARSWEVMRDYNKMLAAGCLVEDTGSGPRRRSISSAKRRCATTSTIATSHNLIRGVALTSEILFASGARARAAALRLLAVDRFARSDSRAVSPIRSRRTRSSASPCTRWAPAAWASTSARRWSIRTARAGTCPAVRRRRQRLSRTDRRQSADHASWRWRRAPAAGCSTGERRYFA